MRVVIDTNVVVSALLRDRPGYLRGSRIEHGLLIVFGSSKLEVRKFVLSDSV